MVYSLYLNKAISLKKNHYGCFMENKLEGDRGEIRGPTLKAYIIVQEKVDRDLDHDGSSGGGWGMVRHWMCLQAEQKELASVRERKSKVTPRCFLGEWSCRLPNWGRLWEKKVRKGVGNIRSSVLDTSSSRYLLSKEAEKLSRMEYISSGEKLLE